MEALIRNWTLCGAMILALAMAAVSALAGVSFFGIMVRLIIGTSVFLVVAGPVSGWMGRSLLHRMVESETPEGDDV